MITPPFLVVSGPTASGKSTLAILLAEKLNGEIINIDSVQVYKGFDIGSAKLLSKDRRGIHHHLIDIVEPNYQFHAGEFIKRAEQVKQEIIQRGKLPIFCGGTSMYITHLIHGLAPLPMGNKEIRSELESKSSEELHLQLSQIDPTTAKKLHPNDRLRVIRAIETSIISGQSLTSILQQHGYAHDTFNPALLLILVWERGQLYARINRRAEEMVENGILEETQRLIALYGRDLPPLKTLGYRQACDVLEGRLKVNQLSNEISLRTRQFAKRQMTYFRNEPTKRNWTIRSNQTTNCTDFSTGTELSSVKYKVNESQNVLDLTVQELWSQVSKRLTMNFNMPEVWQLYGASLIFKKLSS